MFVFAMRLVLSIGFCLVSVISMAAELDCDLNADGACDIDDINLLSGVVIANRDAAPADPIFDLNSDGIMNLEDRDSWLLSAAIENGFGEAYPVGDANLDGSVNAADLMVIGANWQMRGSDFWHQTMRYMEGDFDMDDYVGVRDLNLVGKEWQRSISMASTVSSVPEPSTYLLCVVMAAGLWHLSRQYGHAAISILLCCVAMIPLDVA